ncbi:MAG: 2-dehydro-3-deoxy-6-phosphogalactonate aldolase [Lentisphaeria bacterium]|nr:2-dehydro-3-deoxy-6-phosphogalactonate aldolase [Lentisphaerota bacterium]MBR2626104.1 2-dehydro-3-deoxy-6-phosphogalactonate aldolase [Lentisphaeria bacterium]
MKNTFEKYMQECPLIAILRGITTAEIPAVCDALYSTGIKLLEIPLNSPDACGSISAAIKYCGERQMVGAGTVLSVEDVNNVYSAGGKFIISPNTDPEVIKETKRLGMLSIPGFFTASEAFAARKAGADYLKLFPAILGPSYIKDLKAVIKAPILAVGGVNTENLPQFIEVCAGAGIGSALYKPGKTPDGIAAAAKAMVEAIKN